jgi:hypothetical protein
MASALHCERQIRDANPVMKEKYQKKLDEVRAKMAPLEENRTVRGQPP